MPLIINTTTIPTTKNSVMYDGVALDKIICKTNAADAGTVVWESHQVTITTASINAITSGIAFSQQLTGITQGTITWSISSGSLPAGLSLSAAGLISGTATSYGAYSFTVMLTDSTGYTTKTFTGNVIAQIFTITWDGQSGVPPTQTTQVMQGNNVGTLPTVTRDSYEFGGWFTAAVGGLKIDSSYSVNSNVTFYARWGKGTDIEFGDATSQFNIAYNGDRTNYGNNPYTLYSNTGSLVFQTGISSSNGSNNITSTNPVVTLYLKVTNNGAAGTFRIGFDCDSYIPGDNDDRVIVTRLANGVRLGNSITVTVDYSTAIWVGYYGDRTGNRYNNMSIGANSGSGIDSGYAFTMDDIFINSGSYAILEIRFAKL